MCGAAQGPAAGLARRSGVPRGLAATATTDKDRPVTTLPAAVPPVAHRATDRGHDGVIVIAHRGASGYRPEHTLEAYRLAIRQGADFIEPDLVATGDGVLIARHDNEISGTTDVAVRPEFANRRTRKTVDGEVVSGWFSEDFTLAEVKTLRATERIPAVRPANARFDGMYTIPTFAEVLQLAQRESGNGRTVGVYPETKHPTYFARQGRRLDGSPIAMSLGALLLDTLVSQGFTDPSRVYIQSFEIANLIDLKRTLMPAAGVDLPLVQLYGDLESAGPYDVAYNVRGGADLASVYGDLPAHVDGGLGADTRYGALTTAAALRWLAAHYAAAIAPWKGNLMRRPPQDDCQRDGDGCHPDTTAHGPAQPLLTRALAAGLAVHPYTLRAEQAFLTRGPDGGPQSVLDEAAQLLDWGVQGFFIDQPDLGVAARQRFVDAAREAASAP